jgi:hypothetical protein
MFLYLMPLKIYAAFMKKLRADQVWGMPATRLPRIFCLPVYCLNTKSFKI